MTVLIYYIMQTNRWLVFHALGPLEPWSCRHYGQVIHWLFPTAQFSYLCQDLVTSCKCDSKMIFAHKIIFIMKTSLISMPFYSARDWQSVVLGISYKEYSAVITSP